MLSLFFNGLLSYLVGMKRRTRSCFTCKRDNSHFLCYLKILSIMPLGDFFFLYSWLSLSRPRLSRITAYLEVKIWSLPIHENLTTDGKYCRKEEKLLLRSNFSSFPQYFQYISNFKSPITLPISLLNVVNQIIFSSILQTWYVELRISRSISESPLEFEITRVDCMCIFYYIHWFV